MRYGKGESFYSVISRQPRESTLSQNAGHLDIKQTSVRKFAQSVFAENSVIRNGGYRSYIPARKGFSYKHKTYDPSFGALHWLHIMIGNARAFRLGTYHGLPKDNLQSYLDELCFLFSYRSFGPARLDCIVLAITASYRLNKSDNHIVNNNIFSSKKQKVIHHSLLSQLQYISSPSGGSYSLLCLLWSRF